MRKILNSNLIYYFLAQLSIFFIGIIKITVFTSLFKPEIVGNYALVVALLSYVEIIFLSWISSTFWRYIYDDAIVKNFTHLLSLVIPLLVLAFVTSFVLILGISFYFGLQSAIYPIIVAGYLSIMSQQILTIYFLYLQSVKQIKKWSLLFMLQQIASFLLFLFFASTLHIGITSIFLGSFIINLLFILLLVFLYRGSISQLFIKAEIGTYKKLFTYSYSALLANILLMVLNNADRFILYYFKGAGDLGLYSQSYSLASVGFSSFIQAFTTLLLPFYNKSIIKSNNPNHNASIIKLYLIVFTPAMVVLILHSETITTIFLAPSFRGLHLVFSWALAGIYFYGIANFFEIRLKLLNKIRLVNIILLGVAIFNVVFNFFFIPLFGVTAPATITFASYLTLLCLFLIFNKNFIKPLDFGKLIMHIILVNGLLIIVHFLLSQFKSGISNWNLLWIDAAIAVSLNLILLKRHKEVIQHCYNLTA